MYKKLIILSLYLGSIPAGADYLLGDGTSALYGEWEVVKDIQVTGLTIRVVRSVTGIETDRSGVKNIITCKSGSKEVIDLYGVINDDTSFILDKLLKEIQTCEGSVHEKPTVYMSSGGGNYSDGFKVAKILRKYDAIAVIPWYQMCASSCATAFLGAKFRSIRPYGFILLHAPYTVNSNGELECHSDEKLKAFYQDMLGDIGMGDRLYRKTLSYCGAEVGWAANHDAAELYGIANYKFYSD